MHFMSVHLSWDNWPMISVATDHETDVTWAPLETMSSTYVSSIEWKCAKC